MSVFNFETNLGLRGGKYLIKKFLALKSKLVYLKYQICKMSINSERF